MACNNICSSNPQVVTQETFLAPKHTGIDFVTSTQTVTVTIPPIQRHSHRTTWLPVHSQIKFQLARLTYKVVTTIGCTDTNKLMTHHIKVR